MAIFRTLCAAVFAILFALTVSQAQAQGKFSPPAPKLAIVDIQKIMNEAKAAKSAREQMDAIIRKEQATFAEEEKRLRAKDQELQQQRSLLTPEVFAQRQRELQTEVGRLQRQSRDLRLALDRGFNRTRDQIQLILIDELRKLTKEFDFNMVIARSRIVIAVEEFDITQIALERLDKRLPTIALKLQKTDASDQAR